MKYSNFLLPTQKESSNDYDSEAMKYMVRSGMVKKVSSGMFTYLPYFNMIMRKVEYAIRRGMDNVECSEVKFPLLVSEEALTTSNRWNAYGKEMFKLTDRNNNGYAISPTNEEYATMLATEMVKSYNDLPFSVYQIQRKYRDEIRPRNGLIRAREFTMKDAYSYHRSMDELMAYYDRMKKEYLKIFSGLGIKVVPVMADSGAIGGNHCEEFMAITSEGEASIAFCDDCGYGANDETVPCENHFKLNTNKAKIEKIKTPHVSSIADLVSFLGTTAQNFVKSMVYRADDKIVVALVRGDREVNETKLQKLTGATLLELATEKDIKNIGSVIGFVGPVGLKNVAVFADNEIMSMHNFVVGANERDYHLKNVNPTDFACTWADLRFADENDRCPHCGGHLKFAKGNELGHIFAIGTRYTDKFNSTYVDSNNKNQIMYMGCYGIGLERVAVSIIEQSRDEKGMVLPMHVAPFKVNIIVVDANREEQLAFGTKLYNELEDSGVPVLLDDRKARAGAKFSDHELIGVPIKVVVGKGLENGVIEVQFARTESVQVKLADAKKHILDLIKKNSK